ncbi:MAG: hypothetical protein E7638_04135 [Ruminococcaceae bacterium]|nr:hypothetical protein [Oscillospiraceae bacterium]
MKFRKILWLVLCAVMVLFVGIQTVSAENSEEIVVVEWATNPLYEGELILPPEPLTAYSDTVTAPTAYAVIRTTIADVGADLRAGLKSHQSSISVGYRVKGSYDLNAIASEIFAEAFKHTGVSDEGDYLAWHWSGYSISASVAQSGSYYNITYTYKITYYTTLTQERTVTSKIRSVLDQLNLYNKSDYEKIKGIHDYVCANVKYDSANASNANHTLKFTCYAALINKTAVCQGYASLFYRMALELGIDNRIIYGTSGTTPHVWNVVKLGDSYFYVDTTWDAGRTTYNYFLKGQSDFKGHTRQTNPLCGMYYTRASFYAGFPVAKSVYIPITVPDERAFGVCGDGVFWELESDGELVIYGEGAMRDFYAASYAPWASYASSVRAIRIVDGVSYIGSYAFAGCKSVTEIYLPDSVTSSGTGAVPSNITVKKATKSKMTLLSGTDWFITASGDGRRFLVAKQSIDKDIMEFTECFTSGTSGTANLFQLFSADGSERLSYPTEVDFGMRFQKLDSNGGVADEVIIALWGDMNGDGVVNRNDSIALMWSFLKPDEHGDVLQYDLNGDKLVNLSDAVYHMKNIAK